MYKPSKSGLYTVPRTDQTTVRLQPRKGQSSSLRIKKHMKQFWDKTTADQRKPKHMPLPPVEPKPEPIRRMREWWE